MTHEILLTVNEKKGTFFLFIFYFGVIFQILHYSPGAQFGRRTSADTGSSRISCPPVRGRQRCAAAAYWPEQTLGGKDRREIAVKRLAETLYPRVYGELTVKIADSIKN